MCLECLDVISIRTGISQDSTDDIFSRCIYDLPALGPQTVGPSVPKELKVAIPEKVACRRHNPGTEAIVRPMKVRKVKKESIVSVDWRISITWSTGYDLASALHNKQTFSRLRKAVKVHERVKIFYLHCETLSWAADST